MNRRDFLGTSALIGAASALLPNTAIAQDKPNNKLVFCAFADIHYYPGSFPHDSWDWLQQILDRATKHNADLIIQLGDFTHGTDSAWDYVKKYNDFKIPTLHTPGNHDFDSCTFEKTFDMYNLPKGYKYVDKNGFRIIITDPNYCFKEGKYIHYSKGNYFKLGGGAHVPPEQLEWLKDTIENSPFPCIVTSHQSYERDNASCSNYLQVRKIFNDANEKNPGRVRLVINGHHHHDNIRILDGIVYFDLNSASYEWVPKAHDKYPPEIANKHRFARNTVMYNDPISAIITMTTDGQLTIEGQKSSFLNGITREMTGNSRLDGAGRPCTPDIQSVDLKLNYKA